MTNLLVTQIVLVNGMVVLVKRKLQQVLVLVDKPVVDQKRVRIQIHFHHLIVQLMRNLFMLHLELLHVVIKVVDVQLLNVVL